MYSLIKPAELATLRSIARGKRTLIPCIAEMVEEEATAFVERASEFATAGGNQQVCANPKCSAVRQATGEAFKKCAGCSKQAAQPVFYCSRPCQVQHWKVHKLVCGVVSAPDMTQLALSSD